MTDNQYLEAGTYSPFRILSSRCGAANTGSRFVEATVEHAGQRARWTGWFTAKTAARTFETLEALGYTGGVTKGGLASLNAGPDSPLVGDHNLQIVVEVETYNRKDGSEGEASTVKWINPIGGSGAKALPDDELDSWADAVLGTLVGEGVHPKVVPPTKSYAEQRSEAPSVSDEDLPI